jgi:hypothetical protein
MTTTACYSMATTAAETNTMTQVTGMTSISPIYEASSVTFVEDTQAKTTVDIN